MSGFFDVIALAALLMGGWLRSAGSAVTRIPRADALHGAAEGVRGARTIASLLDDRGRIIPAVGMVCTVLLVVASVLGVVSLERRLSVWGVVIVVFVVVLVGDVGPRLLGRARPRLIAYTSAPLLAAAVKLGGWTAERAVDENNNGVTTDETDESDDETEEIALISSVLRFWETIVREVMVPRPDMITIPADAGSDAIAVAAVEHGFSRFPVVDGDEVVGLLLVKDLLTDTPDGERGELTARRLMRQATFVPEVKQIPDLLTEMKATRTHMAIVVDEFGEIAGLVTIEDLLEELVGEITDETDDDETWVEELGEGRWRVDARLAVEELADLLSTELPDGDWDTVGGLVLGLAERVPQEEEAFDLETASLAVTRMQGRRVAEVVVTSSRATVGREPD